MATAEELQFVVSIDDADGVEILKRYEGLFGKLIDKSMKLTNNFSKTTKQYKTLEKAAMNLATLQNRVNAEWRKGNISREEAVEFIQKEGRLLLQNAQIVEKATKRDKDRAKILGRSTQEKREQKAYDEISAKASATRIGKLQEEYKYWVKISKIRQEEGDIGGRWDALNKRREILKQITTQKEKDALATKKMHERESQYNALITYHAAKRAVGYSVLFSSIFAVSQAFREATDYAMQLDKVQTQLLAVMDRENGYAKAAEDAEIAAQAIGKMSRQYGESVQDISAVALEIGRSGVAYGRLNDATRTTIKLAKLTDDSIQDGTKAIVAYLNTYGKDEMGRVITTVDELGGKLATMANASKLAVNDINVFSNYALQSAQAVGMTIDALGALAISFSNAGMRASTIGTQIRKINEALQETKPAVVDFFNVMGVDQQELLYRMSLGAEESDAALQELSKTMAKMDSSTFNDLLAGFDIQMRNAMQAMRNTANVFEDNLKTMSNSSVEELNKQNPS